MPPNIDLKAYFAAAQGDFGLKNPSIEELQSWAQTRAIFGLGEAWLVAEGLLLLYSTLTGRGDSRVASCKKILQATHKACGSPLLHTEIEHAPDGRYVVTVCERKHEMKFRLRKIR